MDNELILLHDSTFNRTSGVATRTTDINYADIPAFAASYEVDNTMPDDNGTYKSYVLKPTDPTTYSKVSDVLDAFPADTLISLEIGD